MSSQPLQNSLEAVLQKSSGDRQIAANALLKFKNNEISKAELNEAVKVVKANTKAMRAAIKDIKK